MLQIELYSIADRIYTNDNLRHYGIGTISILTFPGGVVKTNDCVLPLGPEHNGPTAEILAAIASLQSVKDEYRKSGKTIFYAPAYARRALVRRPNGEWFMQCTKNVELIRKLRSLLLTYSDITVERFQKKYKPIFELFSKIRGTKPKYDKLQ